ncbi:MAG: formate/nitrite transporter family protein [Actinomycetota bacterium]|nr:formate/nitrite transporter family protein [Actinomycetota bacterium]
MNGNVDDRQPAELPPTQHIPADQVIRQLSAFGQHRIDGLSAVKILILGVMGGAFITAGALFSVLLGSGFESPGARLLVEGFGFSVGFFFVVLSEAALFTEANVVMPATLLAGASPAGRVMRFWGLALLGNLLGAIVLGWAIHTAQTYPAAVDELLAEIVAFKMSYRDVGGVEGWLQLMLSGVLANWLVGMAAFFATMGRTIIGKYIPVFLAVALFVAAGFQHSPANMGYFSLSIVAGGDPGWGSALAWNLIPVGIGNVLGGTLLVALPFWLVYGRER